jgi:hypothetical protein
VILSFVIPSRPGADLAPIKAQIAGLDLAGHEAEFFFVEGSLPPLQRNVGIRQSVGDYVFMLDDDLVMPRHLVSKTLAWFDRERVAVVGGPNLTPADDPPFAQLSGEILASRLATGATSDRWRAGTLDLDATESKLHGCFLCFRGDLLRQYLFVETLFPNDENELISRLRTNGYLCAYVPECAVEHRRRATLRAHLKQVYVSGRGRGETVRRGGLRGQWLYLVPLTFLLYLPAAAVLAPAVPLVAAPLVLYAGLMAAASVLAWRRRRRPLFLGVGPLMFLSHLAYAVGLVKGLSGSTRHATADVKVSVIRTGKAAAS